MDFELVKKELQKLEGQTLKAIKTDSSGTPKDIVLLSVDLDTGCILVAPANERQKVNSRSLGELEKLWVALQKEPAIHVNTVIGGSGTLRHQPETILANLPNVEFLEVDSSIYLALVNSNTHQIGTIKQASAKESAAIIKKLHSKNDSQDSPILSTVIVSNNPRKESEAVRNYLPSADINTLKGGLIQLFTDRTTIVIIPAKKSGLEPGTYSVVKGITIHPGTKYDLFGITYTVVNDNGMQLFIGEA